MRYCVKKKGFIQGIMLLALLLLAIPAQATRLIMISDEDLIVSARAIVKGRVTGIESRYDDRRQLIHTYVTLRVQSVFKGDIKTQEIVVRQVGGQVGDRVHIVHGAPSFAVGEEVLVYLNTAADGALQVAHLSLGKFTIRQQRESGIKIVARELAQPGVDIVDPAARPGASTNQMALKAYRIKIARILAEQASRVEEFAQLNQYRPLLPVPAEFTAGAQGETHTTTLLPVNTRWLEQDAQQPIIYQLNPAGAPVSGGGYKEFARALALHNSLTGSRALFKDGGLTAACGVRADGVNSVSFQDCLEQLDAPVNCTGVLALSGITADRREMTTIAGETFYRAREADLILNNNFQCLSDDSAQLAQLLAKELGHSLGAKAPRGQIKPQVPPVIRSFTPASGPPRTRVTIVGGGFGNSVTVTFNGKLAKVAAQSDTSLEAIVPDDATTGPICVTNAFNETSCIENFIVTEAAPVIDSFEPTVVAIGERLLIRGVNFGSTTQVSFNGKTVNSGFTNSLTTISFTTLPATAETGPICVTNKVGTSCTTPRILTVVRTPTILSFTPTVGKIGDTVNINGGNFVQGVTTVTFGGNVTDPAPNVLNPGQLMAKVPLNAKTGPITVTNKNLSATSSSPFTVIEPPVISSFSPAGGPVGTSVTISGKNFFNVSRVRFDGTDQQAFSVNAEGTVIVTTVPAGATSGPIRVVNAVDGTNSRDPFILPPVISSFSPTSGSRGQEIKISGMNFLNTQAVEFNGVPATFRRDPAGSANTALLAVVPDQATSGKIVVRNIAGAFESTGTFTVLFPPVINGFDPSSGPVGTPVDILGARFTGATAVTFGGVAAAIEPGSGETIIKTRVPMNATTGKICVTNGDGTTCSALDFTVGSGANVPAISGFSPTSGQVNTEVQITGTNFTGTNAVRFNNQLAAFNILSPNLIVAIVPAAATSGKICVSNADGTGCSANNFTVIGANPPVISGFSPASGPAGSQVTITGTNFTGTTAVVFNSGAAAAFMVISNNELRATVPVTASTGPINVTNSDGTASSDLDFIVIKPPVISSLSPTSGPAGTQVTITGTNFMGTSSVTFGGVAAQQFSVGGNQIINVTVPPGASSGQVCVTNPAGTACTSGNFTVTTTNNPPPPTISSFSPASGPVGTSVNIFGTSFSTVSAVKFNGASASFTINSTNSITAIVPAGATTGPISVTNAAGTATSATSFAITASSGLPAISSFTPTSGPVGTSVTISGNNFLGTTAVEFNGGINGNVLANFTINSNTTITAIVPAGAVTGVITISNAAGTVSSRSSFTVASGGGGGNPPTISSFSPSSGPVGTNVNIFGTNFTGASLVKFGGVNASFTVISSSSISATVPPGAVTGPIAVTTAAGTATSATSFIVTAGGGGSTPIINSFSPTSGPVGTSVIINGANFTGTSQVKFGTVAASFTVNGDSSITAIVPGGAVSAQISVTTAAGSALSTTNFVVTTSSGGGLPVINSFSPSSGPVGTSVTISGANFTGTNDVEFSGGAGGIAASFTVNSDSSITAIVPLGAITGPITISNPAGIKTSTISFTVTSGGGNGSAPTITSFTPDSGPAGTLVTINGTDFTGISSVKFGSLSAEFTVISSTTLRATVPFGATTNKITVTNGAGSAQSSTSFIVTSSF